LRVINFQVETKYRKCLERKQLKHKEVEQLGKKLPYSWETQENPGGRKFYGVIMGQMGLLIVVNNCDAYDLRFIFEGSEVRHDDKIGD
jgi:hypothetical protein